jgi:hypothetical protein
LADALGEGVAGGQLLAVDRREEAIEPIVGVWAAGGAVDRAEGLGARRDLIDAWSSVSTEKCPAAICG